MFDHNLHFAANSLNESRHKAEPAKFAEWATAEANVNCFGC